MNTHNVKKGQIFNNYKEICKVLNITPNTGNAKIAQMKELKRYLKWKKEGQKFIILEVYNRPKPKVDLRVNNKGGNNNKYADYIDNLLIQYLLQEKYVNDNDTIKASFSQIFSKNINESKSIIPILTREFADLFKKKIEDVYTEKSLNDIRCLMEYRRIIQNVIQKVLNTSLNRLQKNNIITWQYNYVVNTNTNAIFVGEKDELYYLINKIQDGLFLMATVASDLSAKGIADYLREQENKSLLRFLTCGSVDDGKSTLIGRLLYDTKLIFEDQLAALERDSRKHGTAGDEIDFALLVDGLEAEREQGITIDVAYRFFATDRRKFIVADTPGHEEYTRNMATGASTADLAVVLIDARQGILRQTRRHAYIASLLGIRHIVLAVNKIDLVGYDRAVFDKIVAEFRAFAGALGFATIQPIPLSARHGDNVTRRSENTPWYQGPHLLDHLETVPVEEASREKPFRFPVQYVSRPDLDFRGFAGQVASGAVAVGDTVIVAKSGQSTRIKEIVTRDGSLDRAVEGQAVTLVLEDQLEVSRGNILVAPDDRPTVADQFQAHVIWFDANPMIPGRSYILRTETDSVETTVTALKYEVDVNTFAHLAAKALHMNGVAVCNFSTRAPIAFDSYAANRVTGNFVLIDRMSNRTVGAGMIDFGLRRADNVHWQAMEVDRTARAVLKHQKAAVVWFTGLSGSGKSTVANHLEKLLHAEGRHTYMLDGDNVRHGLNKDLGFTAEDRVENIRRVAEVAKLMTDAGLIVLVSFISPFRSERQLARDLMVEGEFIEVFVDTPIEECARRDPKGLYKKALRGELANFTGISSPYEAPDNPEVHLETVGTEPDELAMRIHAVLESRMGG